MKLSTISAGAMAWGLLSTAAAADLQPLVVINNAKLHFDAGNNTGLIGVWAAESVDKSTAKESAALDAALPDLNRRELMEKELSCVGLENPATGCRRLYVVDASPGELERILKENPEQGVLVATLVMRRSPTTYIASAQIQEVQLKNSNMVDGHRYLAACVNRAPESVIPSGTTTQDSLDRYWSEGNPSFLQKEAVNSVSELGQMLDVLIRTPDERQEVEMEIAARRQGIAVNGPIPMSRACRCLM